MATIDTEKTIDLSDVQASTDNSTTVNMLVEMPYSNGPGKYEFEFDETGQAGKLKLDRELKTDMRYPVHYGFVPKTLAPDDDELDILLVTNPQDTYDAPSVVEGVRPIGVMRMTDDGVEDNKIIAVPNTEAYKNITSVNQIGPEGSNFRFNRDDLIFESLNIDPNALEVPEGEKVPITALIKHFFENYKKEESKDVQVGDFEGPIVAQTLIRESIESYKAAHPELGD